MPSIQEVKKIHEDSLLKIKGVVSVGIGLDINKLPAIVVGLEYDKPELVNKIPENLDGYNVMIQIIGKIKVF